MKNNLISIIIPIYNREKTIQRTLESIIKQTYKNIEIICIDDGSTDKTLRILKTYQKNDKRIKIIYNHKNMGISYSRNIGLKNASGKYIMWCDSDDWYEINMCKEMYTAIKKSNSDIVECSATPHYDEKLNVRKDLNNPIIFNVLLDGLYSVNIKTILQTHCYLWNKIFRKSIIDEYNLQFPNINLHEDYVFVNLYLMLSKKIYFLKKHLYNYNMHPNSAIDKVFEKNSTLFPNIEARIFSTYIPKMLKERNLTKIYPLYNELYFQYINNTIQNFTYFLKENFVNYKNQIIYEKNKNKEKKQDDKKENIKIEPEIENKKTKKIENINILFVSNDNIEKLENSIKSILKSTITNNIYFYILDIGISQKNKEKLLNLQYIKPFYMEFITINKNYITQLFSNNFEPIYLAFLFSGIKPNITKFIYLDSDVIIPNLINKFYNLKFDNSYIIATKNSDIIENINIKNDINTEILLFNNKKIIKDNIYPNLFLNTLTLSQKSHNVKDIVNYILKNKVKITEKYTINKNTPYWTIQNYVN